MRVLAFDPGFERLGVAIIEQEGSAARLLYSTCVRTDKKHAFPERLRQLGESVVSLIGQYNPTHVALEDIFFEKNVRTAIAVAQVRGLLAYEGAKHRLTVCSYTPLQVKIAITGYGRSDKAAVAAMVPRLLTLPPSSRLDDEIDAIAIGLTCLASERYPHVGTGTVAN